jgi:hypothetical protein
VATPGDYAAATASRPYFLPGSIVASSIPALNTNAPQPYTALASAEPSYVQQPEWRTPTSSLNPNMLSLTQFPQPQPSTRGPQSWFDGFRNPFTEHNAHSQSMMSRLQPAQLAVAAVPDASTTLRGNLIAAQQAPPPVAVPFLADFLPTPEASAATVTTQSPINPENPSVLPASATSSRRRTSQNWISWEPKAKGTPAGSASPLTHSTIEISS